MTLNFFFYFCPSCVPWSHTWLLSDPKDTELPTRHHVLFSLPGTLSKPPSPLLPCLNPGAISLEKSFSHLLHSWVVWVPLLCALMSLSLNFLIALLYILFYKCLFTHCLLLPLDHPLSIHCKCHADIDYWPWSSCWTSCSCCPELSAECCRDWALVQYSMNFYETVSLIHLCFQQNDHGVSSLRESIPYRMTPPTSDGSLGSCLESCLYNEIKWYFARRESPRISPLSWPQSSYVFYLSFRNLGFSKATFLPSAYNPSIVVQKYVYTKPPVDYEVHPWMSRGNSKPQIHYWHYLEGSF